jgi:hypothetical protein
MSERIHALAFSLFGKSSVDELELSEIQQLADNHPYFAPAQFLLLQKLKNTNPEAYQAQLQKAVLYYPNPLEFEHFINSDRFYTELDFSDRIEGSTDTETLILSDTTEEVVSIDSSPEEEDIAVDKPEEFNQPIEQTQSTQEKHHSVVNSLQAEDLIQEKEVEIPTLPQLQTHPDSFRDKPQTDLTFEPYHTVDYFASQGIKLSQEEISKDKFGKQLKSFTEWLKSMKRLPAPDVQKPESHSEKNVQHLAEDSIHNADVVTEAMAEVWLKQGNREKAIETYNKLSLLNPSKKAYFAGLIQNLKNS